MSFHTGIGQSLANPFVTFWNSLVFYLPGVVAALVIIVLGYWLGLIAGTIVKQLIKKFRIDRWVSRTGRGDALGGLQVSTLSGQLVKWWIFVVFLAPAADMVKLDQLSELLQAIALWAPNLIVAIILMIGGLIFADFLADSAASAKKLKGIKAVSTVIRIVIIIFFADVALRQVGIRIVLAELTILIIVSGIVLALAIGFGLGLKEEARDIIKGWRRKLK
jgi:hypothetical protein